ncbi:MAG: FHA domain-containing protein, partial [Planctomycetaceae bacterium]|nr:FHA domain-containing protein [Planctomycetaceae bacterium]
MNLFQATTRPAGAAEQAASGEASSEDLSARLVFRQADRPPVVKDILRPTTVIGSADHCNVRLQAPGILPVHTVLTLDGSELLLRDIGSRQGTLVNGERVSRHRLTDGDTVQIGPFPFVVEASLPVDGATDRGHDAPSSPSATDPAATAGGEPAGTAQLVHVSRDGGRMVKNLMRETTLFGSARGCSVQLAAEDIEPVHCMVTRDGGLLRLRDLRSRTGTFLNGERVTVAPLNDGDQLRIGQFSFTVESSLAVDQAPVVSHEETGRGDDVGLGFDAPDTCEETAQAPTHVSVDLSPEQMDRRRQDQLASMEARLRAELGALAGQVPAGATEDSEAGPGAAPLLPATGELPAESAAAGRFAGSLQAVWTQLQTFLGLLQEERRHLAQQRKELSDLRLQILASGGAGTKDARPTGQPPASPEIRNSPAAQAGPAAVTASPALPDAAGAAVPAAAEVLQSPQAPWRSATVDAAESTDDARCAEQLLRRGMITDFQAEWFLHNRMQGAMIDQYRLRHLIDVGGMGWVYSAQDTQTGRTVALKVLFQHYVENPELRMRFELESRAGIRLDHPQIVRMYSSRRSGPLFYIVMDFVQGINLHELAALHGPTAWPLASELMRQTALALDYAHQTGMVHRDIKPANLLLDHTGQIRILDFGLALLPGDADEQMLAEKYGQRCLGTADFIAPEQSIDSFHVDGRADLYSLGCTLYFALTAELPFPAKT